MPDAAAILGISPQRTMSDRPSLADAQLVERETEQQLVERSVRLLHAGRGGTLLFCGPAGIGKSRMAREVLTAAAAAGAVTSTGRCAEETPAPALRPLAEAIWALLRGAPPLDDPDLGPFHSVLAPLVPQWRHEAEAVAGSERLLLLGEGVSRLLRLLSGSRPVVLVVEDAQWADSETLEVLEYLADHAGAAALLLVVTLRAEGIAEPSSPPSGLLRRLGARRVAEVVELRRLSASGVAELASDLLGGAPVSSELAELIADRSDGVPFFVEELLAEAWAEGLLSPGEQGWAPVPRLAEVLPRSVVDLTRARLLFLPEAGRRLLRAGAAWGREFPAGLAGQAAQVAEDAGDLLRAARDSQLLEPFRPGATVRFRHALLRDAILADLSPGERQSWAERLVGAADAAGLAAQHAATVGRLCAEAGKPARAVDVLIGLADTDAAHGAFDSAQATLEEAITLAGDNPALRAATSEALLDLWVRVGRSEDAAGLGQRLLVELEVIGAGPVRRAGASLLVSRAESVAGHYDHAWQLLAEADEQAGPGAGVDFAADLATARAHLALLSGRLDQAGSAVEVAVAAAERSGSPHRICAALEVRAVHARLYQPESAVATLERLLALAESRGLRAWRIRALHELGALDLDTTGRLDRLEEAAEAAMQAGAVGMAARIELTKAFALAIQFRRQEMLAAAERAAELGRRYGLGLYPVALAVTGAACGLLGRRAQREARLAEAARLAPADATVQALSFEARGVCALLEERRAEARDAFDRAVALPAQLGSAGAPYWGFWALVRSLEDLDGAGARQRVRAEEASHKWWSVALLCFGDAVDLGRQGRVSDAEAAVAEAERICSEQVSADWLLHLCRRLVGEAAAAGGWGEPTTWWREAAGFFDQAGVPKVAAACRSLLNRAGAARRRRGRTAVPEWLAVSGVTGREVDVLLALGEGLSNREIAEMLYLSPRTVEKHIESLFRKLGVGSRTRLALMASPLAEGGDGSALTT